MKHLHLTKHSFGIRHFVIQKFAHNELFNSSIFCLVFLIQGIPKFFCYLDWTIYILQCIIQSIQNIIFAQEVSMFPCVHSSNHLPICLIFLEFWSILIQEFCQIQCCEIKQKFLLPSLKLRVCLDTAYC